MRGGNTSLSFRGAPTDANPESSKKHRICVWIPGPTLRVFPE